MEMIGPSDGELDPVNERMGSMSTTVVSTTLDEPLDWPDATLVRGDAVYVVARLKAESGVPQRSRGSSTGFVYVTVWEDVASIQNFAGERWEEAVISPEEEHLLQVTWIGHYEALSPTG
jgi:hypothetical protein